MKILDTHIVPEGVTRIRFSDYVSKAFPTFSTRNAAKKAIKRGEFLINGNSSTTGAWVESGQKIDLIQKDIDPPKLFNFPIDVIFQDEYLAVIHKPAGIEVSGNKFKTIENALPGSIPYSKAKDALPRPRAVHRLDYATSGLLVIARTRGARIELGRAFELKTIEKRYRAVVIGEVPDFGHINEPIDGKPAETRFKLVRKTRSVRNGWLSLVDLFPLTGRTHQLRLHMAGIGNPILGDKIHGTEGHILKGKGMFLCAVELCFLHPVTNEKIKLNIEEPRKFQVYMEGEQRRWENYDH